MSFSTNVKDELSRHMSKARHCRMAELSSILSIGAKINLSAGDRSSAALEVTSDHRALIGKTEELLWDLFRIRPEVSRRIGRGGIRARGYALRVRSPHTVRRILKELDMLETAPGEDGRLSERLRAMPDERLKRVCCRRAYLRGAFLSGGSINDPTKNYHIEILTGSVEEARRLKSFLASFDVDSRVLERARQGTKKRTNVLYLKNADQITDVLRIIKAPLALMELENVRVEKDVINHVQRQVNCEAANISKIVNASLKQTEAIRYLKAHRLFDRLSPELKEVAQLRLSFPDMALKDLGSLLDPPISKSGVNHRLKKIEKNALEAMEAERAKNKQ